MKVLPAHIWNKNLKNNKGEPQVFDLLRQINLSKNDIALHSQNLAGGIKQSWSEIDYLVLSQRAIIGIEVKAGVVKSVEGMWYVLKPNGDVAYSKRKSPFVQVSDALESLRTGWFYNTFKRRFTKVPFVKLSILCSNYRPDFTYDSAPPELPDEFTIYSEDLEPEKFKTRINLAIDYHIKNFHHGFNQTLTSSEVHEIAHTIRPNIDVSYASQSALNALKKDQNRLTEQQYTAVDMFCNFDRLLIEGGAGTGKTFILIYGALQEASLGNKVAVLTKAKKLLNYMHDETGDKVTCIDGNNISLDFDGNQFDVLFIDEGQDLCNPDDLDALDHLLVNGLSGGRWRWFADFENQFDLRYHFDEDCLTYLKETTGNNSIIHLTHNVRNTPNIVQWLETVCRARIGETKVKGAGPEVRLVDTNEFESLLCCNQYDARYGEIDTSEAALLYVHKNNVDDIDCLNKLIRHGCNISKIDEYKGMEAMFVFIVGLDEIMELETLRDIAYKSVSRARSICFIRNKGNLSKSFRRIKKGHYE